MAEFTVNSDVATLSAQLTVTVNDGESGMAHVLTRAALRTLPGAPTAARPGGCVPTWRRGITSWDQVTRTHIRAWIDSGRHTKPPKADTTLAAWHWGAAALFRYLEAEEWDGARRSPMASMAAPVPKSRPVDVLSLSQVRAILAACKGSPRDEAIIRVATDTGLRIAELAGIKAAEVNLGEVTTVLVQDKGGRDRYVRLSPKTALALRRYLRQRARHRAAHREALWLGHHGPLTASGIYKIITSRGRQAGLTTHPAPAPPHLGP